MKSRVSTPARIALATAIVLVAGASCSPAKDANAANDTKDKSKAKTNQAKATVSSPAPPIVLRDLAGHYVFLSRICYPGKEKRGKPKSAVVLNFMATDCPPCIKEIPMLLKVARLFKSKGVRTFLISTDEIAKQAEVEKLVKDQKIDCTVLLDPYKVACKKYGVKAIPRTFVISMDGIITAKIQASDKFDKELKDALTKTLKKSPKK